MTSPAITLSPAQEAELRLGKLGCPECGAPTKLESGDDPRWRGETPTPQVVDAIHCELCGFFILSARL